MSDEPVSSPESTPAPEAKSAPRVRRISTPRPKKGAAEVSASPESGSEPSPLPTARQESIPFPSSPPREESSENASQVGNDWPEPEAESSSGGVPSQSESSKRKRRRRMGKGQGQGHSSQINAAAPSEEETPSSAAMESKPADAPQDQRPRSQPAPPHQAQQRPKIDPELLTEMAWKIYLAEVSEEGVALIGDNDAKDLSRRCFRLAEIFIEEQSRRR